jgi:hypothetical protein
MPPQLFARRGVLMVMMKTFSKLILALTLSFLVAVGLRAEEGVVVQAKIIEAPLSAQLSKADCESKDGLNKRGVQVLSAPRVLTRSGAPACVFVGQILPVPSVGQAGLTNVQAGLELKILPTLEGDVIKYTVSVLVRKQERIDATPGHEQAEISSREYHGSGSCRSGESVLLPTRGLQDNRKLYVYLSFTRQSLAK